MQSGRADPRVHVFYEGLGFRPWASGRLRSNATEDIQRMIYSSHDQTTQKSRFRHSGTSLEEGLASTVKTGSLIEVQRFLSP
jgi:hypothetical protein